MSKFFTLSVLLLTTTGESSSAFVMHEIKNVLTKPDYVCAGTKIIPDRTFHHTQERLWRRDFCDGAKLSRADIESGKSHVGEVLCHTLLQCEQLFGSSGK